MASIPKNSNVTVTFDSQGMRVMKRLADALEKANKISASGDQRTLDQNAFNYGREYALAAELARQDDETLAKVCRVIEEQGFTYQAATMLISALQNEGISFRNSR